MLNEINFYQLDNLITNRVPFVFLNFSESLTPWYNSVSKLHLEIYEQLANLSSYIDILGQKNASKDAAIILLCSDGKISLKIFAELQTLGYTNVYVVNGGYQQLVTERAQN